MKTIKKINLALMAFVLGTGLALSTSAFTPFVNNVYNSNTTDPLSPSWNAIPAGHSITCDQDTRFDCTGTQATPGGPVTNITKGKATLH